MLAQGSCLEGERMTFTNISLFLLLMALIIWRLKLKNSLNYSQNIIGFYRMLRTLGIVLFLVQFFIPYSSAEKAYKSVYGGEIYLVVEGTTTDYVVGSRDEVFLEKTKLGWNVPMVQTITFRCVKSVDTTRVEVIQYGDSNEYYVFVQDYERKDVKVSDNRDTTFCQLTGNEGITYIGYINGISDTYVVTVDEDKVFLFE